jgi:glycosyltransferase involved in cell wall biosynthesis
MGENIAINSRENGEHNATSLDPKRSLMVIDFDQNKVSTAEILFISSYPPRECGIANYSRNLINALNNRFSNYFNLKVCALEHGEGKYYYPAEVTETLNTLKADDYERIAGIINTSTNLSAVIIQHEFGLFTPHYSSFEKFIKSITKPVILVFHSVISKPDIRIKQHVQKLGTLADSIIVMAQVSKEELVNNYQIHDSKISVIPYGNQLVNSFNVNAVKEKYKLTGKTVITSFGLLSPDKGIETILEALPQVIKNHPEIKLLIIGKTHPETVKKDGESYRIMLEARTKSLKLQNHVQFINAYFPTDILTEYLQASDICIFSCTDSNRPMSGTFSTAISCGCAIISTPTPHASEFLDSNAGLIFESGNASDLSEKINLLIDNPALRKKFSDNISSKSLSASWENSAVYHGEIINRVTDNAIPLTFKAPPIRLDFIRKLTDKFGILRSSYKGEPDIRMGYTSNDNAFALFVLCMHYKITGDVSDLLLIRKYLKFLFHCYQSDGVVLKYLDYERKFTSQNYAENLEETQAKAIWALGYVVSMKELLPPEVIETAQLLLQNILPQIKTFTLPHCIAFTLKGLYYNYSVWKTPDNLASIKFLANKLVEMYRNKSDNDWKWFDSKFTSSSSVIPGALLNTWLITGENIYKEIAIESFDFFSSKVYQNDKIETCSLNNDWQVDNQYCGYPGEYPCDIAFNVITLSKFYLICKEKRYFQSMEKAFNWFLGNNRLKLMVYNPVAGSCFDGLEDNSVNLGQSANSILCYTLSRMIVEKYKFIGENHILV